MALITCPHCGKSVSDTALMCIHCGGRLKETPPVPKEYKDLSYAEKETLSLEFERKYPKYAFLKLQKSNKRLETAFIVCIILYLVFSVLSAVLMCFGFDVLLNDTSKNQDILQAIFTNSNLVLGFVSFGISILVLVFLFIFAIRCRKERKKYLLHYKIFVKWLLTRKQIICRPEFPSRQQLIFDGFDIENYRL